jgi:hypothetical protein
LTIRQIFNEMPKGTFISVYLSEKKVWRRWSRTRWSIFISD